MQFGVPFKGLGCRCVPQLLMHAVARHVAIEAGWRLQTFLRLQRFFSTKDIIRLYKAQVLSLMESSKPGLRHAAPSVLQRVGRVQRR